MRNFKIGFELEGKFNQNIYYKTRKLGDYKGDGSVTVSDYLGNSIREEEFASYANFVKPTLELLRTFIIGENYIYNNTCGLHLHVSLFDYPSSILQNLATSWSFISKLQGEAGTMCECVQARLKGNRFCQKYNKANFMYDAENGTKYRFCRFHPIGTLEFRFLAPCEHREDNIMKLLTLIDDYLFLAKKIYSQEVEDEKTKNQKIIINFEKIENAETINIVIDNCQPSSINLNL